MNLHDMKLNDIRDWFKAANRTEIELALPELKKDKRSGVKQLLKQWEQQELKREHLLNKWKLMNQEEDQLKKQGITYIAGIDEVGRGPLAGPVVACAVILPTDFYLLGIDDSKKLHAAERERMAEKIQEEALSYSISYVDSKEIDRLNIYQATLQAMERAVKDLQIAPEYLLIDAMKLSLNIPQTSIIKGDASSISIAAASILAKVSRDTYMKQMADLYPQYGFDRNMGYGTKEHLEAIQYYGITPIHRRSFLTNQLEMNISF